jgi:hypothetical protein
MARTNASDAAKASAAAANTTAATPAQQTPAENTPGPAAATGTQDVSNTAAEAVTGPALPSDPANGIGSTVQAGQPSSGAAGAAADAATVGTETSSLSAKPATGDQLQADSIAEDSNQITIYPLRSYLDDKEVRRAGGKGYKSPKHDAVSLIAAGLATDKNPKT